MRKVTKTKKPKVNASIGEKLKFLRTNAGYTQEYVAKQIMKDRSIINRYENDSRPIVTEDLKALAKLYNASTDYLLGLTDFESPNADYKKINEVIGLSNKAIKILENFNNSHYLIPTLNLLIEQEEFQNSEEGYIQMGLPIISIIDWYLNLKVSNEKKAYIHNLGFEWEEDISENFKYFYKSFEQINVTKLLLDESFMAKINENIKNLKEKVSVVQEDDK